jgi:hypothetical protein
MSDEQFSNSNGEPSKKRMTPEDIIKRRQQRNARFPATPPTLPPTEIPANKQTEKNELEDKFSRLIIASKNSPDYSVQNDTLPIINGRKSNGGTSYYRRTPSTSKKP